MFANIFLRLACTVYRATDFICNIAWGLTVATLFMFSLHAEYEWLMVTAGLLTLALTTEVIKWIILAVTSRSRVRLLAAA